MSTSIASTSNVHKSRVAEPLYQVKLLAALRNGDKVLIHELLDEVGRGKRREFDDDVDIGAAALHLAIRCASAETVQLLLSHRSISPNAEYPRGSGTTPLHLAASIGRADIVTLLLDQDEIDDTLRDANGQTCKDVARGKDVLRALKDSKNVLTASFRTLLQSYIHSPPDAPPPQALLHFLSSPRAHLVDLSYLEPATGRSILHEAARRKDLKLIDLSIRAGADVFVRDRRGKGVGESGAAAKDEKVKVFLRQFTNQDTTLLENPSSEPPTLKGYLSKYTNVAKGYNTRWFVLRNGVLSYYRFQEDENVASRGSIALKAAVLKYRPLTPAERLRFEIQSIPSRVGSSSGQQKWYIKGNHEVEVTRWVQALQRSIDWYRKDGTSGSEGDARSLKNSLRTSIASSHTPGHSTFLSSSASSAFSPSSKRSGKLPPFRSSTSSLTDVELDREAKGVGQTAVEIPDSDSDGEFGHSDESIETHANRVPPHDNVFALHGNTASAQIDLSVSLLQRVSLPTLANQDQRDVIVALNEALIGAQRLVSEYVTMVSEREEWWRGALERERERGALWEESLQTVVKEGEALENELKARARRKIRIPSESVGVGRKASLQLFAPPPVPSVQIQPATPSGSGRAGPFITATTSGLPSAPDEEVAGEIAPPASSPVVVPPSTVVSDIEESVVDTDEEDEFFDAIESNNLPNVMVAEALVSGPPASINPPQDIILDQYVGYKELRARLPIEKDTRPPTSLWSVLKHSIGKDLTKISFPVFFNEPTSMLQRMAEDMEFSECLDAAAAEADAHQRIAFVAAFAMSNYSSTIGRIAKPFNPMLSETFEYVRLDKKYRYVSEQVSHHPPISACYAESPLWHYFGEVDAQNRFMGKSFEIRPTGVAHAELVIPEEFTNGRTYPKAASRLGEGKVVEHYTWKKVTTNVSGFILGSPTIDHYGEMTIVNHRTGDTCVLTFKPRGWRGKDAYEILGRVMDAEGNVVYEIAGRWNSQLVARPVGTGIDALHPDVSINSTPGSPGLRPEYILLWRNTEKPPAPFNLTPFAITLNDCPEETLRPYIAPTDCRLRPDQRAFELGKYERANELKQKQEELQRATRRAREEGRLPPHRPRWFEARTEKDTAERVWEPLRTETGELAFWKERERVWKGEGKWRNIEKIFINDLP